MTRRLPSAATPFDPLVESGGRDEASAIRDALRRAGIPFLAETPSDRPDDLLFHVPRARIEVARRAVRAAIGREPEWLDAALEPSGAATADPAGHGFPRTAVELVAAVIVVHLALVLWAGGSLPPGGDLLRMGGLVAGRTLEEPWRLLTSIFLHSGFPHALRNAVPMLIFAVPLLSGLGAGRTALLYLAAGLGGGLTAVGFAATGTTIVGSSGAVAGLFGGWIVLTLRGARLAALSRRARVRALGIALLFLPSLINPVTPEGRPVSISSHMGGLLTGMLVGALISNRMLARREATGPMPD